METRPIDQAWRIPDELWRQMEPLLPKYPASPLGGRPRLPLRQVADGIFYLLRTGCQWKALPPEFGSASAVHEYFQEWVRLGVFHRLWLGVLRHYDKLIGIDWNWLAVDGATTKAPLGGDGTGDNPTDRSKSGTKRSVMTDGNGIPLAIQVSGANSHDKTMLHATIKEAQLNRPRPSESGAQHLCLDKGYDYADIRKLVKDYLYIGHIPHRGEQAERKPIPGYRAHRWVVERTHSWFNRFRRLLIRWEKSVENYIGLLHLSCAWITLRAVV
jgi:putative transposase